MGKARFGGSIGPNPTDRGKAGTKRSLACGWRGRPLEHACGSKRAFAKLRPWTPLYFNDHSPLRRNPNTCVWTKGMTPSGRGVCPPDMAIGSTSDAGACALDVILMAPSRVFKAIGLWKDKTAPLGKCRDFTFVVDTRTRLRQKVYSSHVRYGAPPTWPGHSEIVTRGAEFHGCALWTIFRFRTPSSSRLRG